MRIVSRHDSGGGQGRTVNCPPLYRALLDVEFRCSDLMRSSILTDGRRGHLFRQAPHRRHEPVALPGHREDVAVRLRAVAENPAQCGDVARQVPFLHNAVGPDVVKEFVLGNRPLLVLDQESKRVEDLGRKGSCPGP